MRIMRIILLTAAAMAFAPPVQAKPIHHRHHQRHHLHHQRHSQKRQDEQHRVRGLVPVTAPGGIVAYVARSAQARFQGFVTALSRIYHIAFMGGWRAHGSCGRCDMHPRGLAIDINQTARNRVIRRFPPGVTALAASYGLLHGAVWKNADTGHFEVAGVHHSRAMTRSRSAASAASRRYVHHQTGA